MNIKNILVIIGFTLALSACGGEKTKIVEIPGDTVIVEVGKPELVVAELNENCNIFEGCRSLSITAPNKTHKINFNFMRKPERAILLVDGNELLLDDVGFIEIPSYEDPKFILIVQ